MSETSFPPPTPEPAGEALRMQCPACGRKLSLDQVDIGVEGFCPACRTPLVARHLPDGSVGAAKLPPAPDHASADAAASSPASRPPAKTAPAPPLPSRGGTVLQTQNGFYVEARPLRSRSLPAAFAKATLIAAILAGGVALSVYLRGNNPPISAVAEPGPPSPEPAPPSSGAVLEASSSAPLPVGPTTSTAETPTPAETPPLSGMSPAPNADTEPEATPAPPADSAGLARSAEKTLRDFLAATKPWEKLAHVLEPEEDLLSILAFQDLDPVSADTVPRHVETRREETERLWLSLLEWTERDGTSRTLCVVRRDDDPTSRFDFSLYWQDRTNLLEAFLTRTVPGKALQVRVHVGPAPPGPTAPVASEPGPEPPVRYELAQPFGTFRPVVFAVPARSPVRKELDAWIGEAPRVPAILELVDEPSASEPGLTVPTIGRIVRTGWWSPGPE